MPSVNIPQLIAKQSQDVLEAVLATDLPLASDTTGAIIAATAGSKALLDTAVHPGYLVYQSRDSVPNAGDGFLMYFPFVIA